MRALPGQPEIQARLVLQGIKVTPVPRGRQGLQAQPGQPEILVIRARPELVILVPLAQPVLLGIQETLAQLV